VTSKSPPSAAGASKSTPARPSSFHSHTSKRPEDERQQGFYGDARKEVWDGIEHTHAGDFASIHMTPADGVAQRTQKALKYLDQAYPDEDWGYYLNADGSVRWSDVILTGMSHGASNVARWAMLVRSRAWCRCRGPATTCAPA